MGTSLSKKLRDKYEKGKYRVEFSCKDKLLGDYSLVSFSGSRMIFLQKAFNPTEYDQYTDINTILKMISKRDKNIADYIFLANNHKQGKD